MPKVQFLDSENVRLLTEDNKTLMNMTSRTFNSLQHIIQGEIEIIDKLDINGKSIINVEIINGDFCFQNCG